MFTGIIAARGEVTATEASGGDLRLTIDSGDLAIGDLQVGESIATSGVCLTVAQVLERGFVADVSVETLELTTLSGWHPGQKVNLERALRLADRLGGHLVSGHVDGIGTILSRHSAARAEAFRVRAPQDLARYIAHKGSIAVDGVSLTVNGVSGSDFDLTIVPHTLQETTMADYREGTEVNLEVDLLARYLERLRQEAG